MMDKVVWKFPTAGDAKRFIAVCKRKREKVEVDPRDPTRVRTAFSVSMSGLGDQARTWGGEVE